MLLLVPPAPEYSMANGSKFDRPTVRILSPQPTSSVSRFSLAERAKKPANTGLLRILQSLKFQDSNQNSLLVRKVSRVFLGNGGFAESKSGDWFDHPLRGGHEPPSAMLLRALC
jgi:hypothetical protein